jgi:hypothetical protein
MRRGVSLVEVLLASALLSTMLVLLVRVLIPLLHYFSWTAARAELMTASGLVRARLQTDFQKARWEGVVLPTGVAGDLCIHPLADITPTGQASWSSQAIVYHWDVVSGDLTRKLWTPSPALDPSVPFRPDLVALAAVAKDANLSGSRLLRGQLKEISVLQNGHVLQLHLVLQMGVPGRSAEILEQNQEFVLRNES